MGLLCSRDLAINEITLYLQGVHNIVRETSDAKTTTAARSNKLISTIALMKREEINPYIS